MMGGMGAATLRPAASDDEIGIDAVAGYFGQRLTHRTHVR